MSVRRKFAKAILLVLLVSIATITAADHPPTSKLARGKDELSLAGIEVYDTSVPYMKRMLGAPAEEQEISPAEDGIVGERSYLWRKPGISVRVVTEFAANSNDSETARVIAVDGTNGEIGRTGRGLRLGDASTSIERVYGNRYVKKGQRVTVQWKSTTTLVIGWDKRGNINRIRLLGAE